MDAAYRATRYVVELPGGPLPVRVGRPAQELDEWLSKDGWRCWSWLTSANPGSRRLGDAENADRLAALQAALDAQEVRWFGATAIADDGLWPDEEGVFVPGLERDAAYELAHRFGQAAYLYGAAGGAPQLIWIDEPYDGASTGRKR